MSGAGFKTAAQTGCELVVQPRRDIGKGIAGLPSATIHLVLDTRGGDAFRQDYTGVDVVFQAVVVATEGDV